MKIETLTNEEILELIHKSLEENNLTIDKDKASSIDELMIKLLENKIIEEQVNIYKENFKTSTEEKIYEYVLFVLIKYYYALYNNNIELYKLIVEKNISLGNSIKNNKLYLLDHNISKIFRKKEDYLNFVSECEPSIRKFYKSLDKVKEEEKEKYIKDFVKLIKSDKRYLYRKVFDDKKIFINIINVKNLDIFTEEVLEKLIYTQKDLLDNLDRSIKDENLLKLKDILTNDKINISNSVINNDFLEKFSIEEMENMTEEISILLNKALHENILYQVNELINKKIILPVEFIRYEIFENIDNETIEKLSNKAIKEISKLNIDDDLKKKIKKIIKKDLNEKESIIDKVKKRINKK